MFFQIFNWSWAAIPIWLAVQLPWDRGDYGWLPAYIMGGAAAPVGLYLATVVQGAGWRLLAFSMFLIAATWNVSNAVGSSAHHRQAQSAPDTDRIKVRNSLHGRDVWLAQEIVRIGWRLERDTSDSIVSKIRKLKTTGHYLRTNGCQNLKTLDPERVCATLADEEGRLSEARVVEKYQAEREEIRKKLLEIADPKTADTQADSIHRMLAKFMTIDIETVIAILNILGPLASEFIGTVAPAILERLRRQRNESGTVEGGEDAGRVPSLPSLTLPHNVENSLPGAVEDDPPTLPQPSPELTFADWRGEHVEEGGEDTLQARQIFLHCLSWCDRHRVQAPSERAFSDLMKAAGYNKQKLRGVMHYVGIRLKSTQLKVVK